MNIIVDTVRCRELRYKKSIVEQMIKVYVGSSFEQNKGCSLVKLMLKTSTKICVSSDNRHSCCKLETVSCWS